MLPVDVMVENKDFPAPQLEWMLTDKCGNTSTGNVSGMPYMIFNAAVTYAASQTVYQGQAVQLSNTYGYTIKSPSMSQVVTAVGGYTFTGWYYITNSGVYYSFIIMGYLDGSNTLTNWCLEYWWFSTFSSVSAKCKSKQLFIKFKLTRFSRAQKESNNF